MQELRELLKKMDEKLEHIEKYLINSVSYRVFVVCVSILTLLLIIAYFKSLEINKIKFLGKEIEIEHSK